MGHRRLLANAEEADKRGSRRLLANAEEADN